MKKVFLVRNPKIDQQDRKKDVKNYTTRNQSHFDFEVIFGLRASISTKDDIKWCYQIIR